VTNKTRWRRLHRARAMTLRDLRNLNERVESEARRLRACGIDDELDRYTDRLGGTEASPGLSGLFLEAYIERALELGLIDPDEFEIA
jgi:hypothetical protein